MRSLSDTNFTAGEKNTAELLTVVLATTSTDIIAQIVTSTDSTTGNIIVVVVAVDTVLASYYRWTPKCSKSGTAIPRRSHHIPSAL